MSNISDKDSADQGMTDVQHHGEPGHKQTPSEPAPVEPDPIQDMASEGAVQPKQSDVPPADRALEPAPEQPSGPIAEPVSEPFSEPFSAAVPETKTAQFEGNEPFPSPEATETTAQAGTESAPAASPAPLEAAPALEAKTVPQATPEDAPAESTPEATRESTTSPTPPTPSEEPVSSSVPAEPAPEPTHTTPEPASASAPTSSLSPAAPSPAAPHPQAPAAPSTPDPISSGIVGLIIAKARAIKQIRRQKKLLKIMTLFARKDTITNDDVERSLRVSDATATRYLSELEALGKIVQVGKTGRGVEYRAKG